MLTDMRVSKMEEMEDHLRTIRAFPGTEKANTAAITIGFFLDSIKDEMKEMTHDDEEPFFLNPGR